MNKEINEFINSIFKDLKGKLISEEDKITIEREAVIRERVALAHSRLVIANMPKRHLSAHDNLTFDSDWGGKLKEMKKAIGSGLLLLLIGPPGTGKTQMACELIRHGIMENGKSGLFRVSMAIKLEIKSTWGENAKNISEVDVIDKMRNTGILCLDEIDWLFGNRDNATEDYWTSVFYYIINSRYNLKLDTILTSNRTLEDLQELLPAAVWGRLNESGGIVRMDGWTDWRAREC